MVANLQPSTGCNFNPRSPHGERRNMAVRAYPEKIFQSTLPARGATGTGAPNSRSFLFQSTLPARGATQSATRREGAEVYFNPRSPHGERRYRDATRANERRFQSTLPARGATQQSQQNRQRPAISIHAPRTGSDAEKSGIVMPQGHFNPRSPHGERL